MPLRQPRRRRKTRLGRPARPSTRGPAPRRRNERTCSRPRGRHCWLGVTSSSRSSLPRRAVPRRSGSRCRSRRPRCGSSATPGCARADRVATPTPGDGRDAPRSGWRHRCDRPPSTGRCRGMHHVVQLSDREHGGQDRARLGDGQHCRRPTGRSGPARDREVRRVARGRRVPAGRRERRHRLHAGVGGGTGFVS